jgi:hypothetical protein
VGAAYAVDVNARIKGTVTDPSGAVVPNATVTATNTATGVKYPTKANSTGDYFFAQLPVGTYSVTVNAPGFKAFVATGIVLTIDKEYVEPVKLEVGNQSETLEVAADAVQVNTTDMQLNNIVDSRQMVELPLINRNFTGLELVEPGVQAASDRFGTLSVSGSQTQQSEYTVNGADDNDIALNTIVINPILDAIDQFNLIDGPLNAEYDRNSGGIVSATIKQGTNHIHGDGFEFYRDTFLNTNNFFQKTYTTAGVRTDHVTPYHQNIFGGTAGGPIWRDKMFIFGGYQGIHQRVPGTSTSNHVYFGNQLNGDFSNDNGTSGTRPLSAFTNPDGSITPAQSYGTFSGKSIPSTIVIPGCTTPLETWAQCAFDLNQAGTQAAAFKSAFNSVSSALVKQYVPAPTSGTNGFNYNPTSKTSTNQYLGRVDYALNPKNQFTVVAIYLSSTVANDLPFTGATLPGFGDGSLTHAHLYTFDYVHQFSPTLVNDISAHYVRLNFNSGAPQKVVQPSSVGFNINPQDTSSATVPKLTVTGFFTLGGTSNGPQPRIDQTIQFDDSVSKTFGHHNLKFGYDGRRFNVSNTFDASNSGSYGFASTGTFSSGDASLDFLLGVPSSYGQGTGSIIQADAFLNYMYAQDNWKATNTLTVSYGLGYSIDTPLRNHQNGGEAVSCAIPTQSSVIFPGAPKGMNFPGDPGCTNSSLAYTRYTEFGPRFGFAWAPDLGWISGAPGKFSIRGGFGIYYDRSEEETSLQTLGTQPFGFTSAGAGDFSGKPQLVNPFADINGGKKQSVGGAAGGSLTAASQPNRFPYVQPVKGQVINWASFGQIFNISSYDSSFRAPYAENFQLSVERELPSKIVARLSYVGSLARRNQTAFEGFPVTPAGHAACVADPVCQANADDQQGLYPQHTTAPAGSAFIETGLVGSYGSSNYNSMQIDVTKAPTHGLSFQLSYTYAHSLDNASSFENSGFSNASERGYNQYQPGLNYGDSEFDARHRLVISPIYITPILHGSSWYSPKNLLLSGWEISGITTLATGFPFDISYGGFGVSNSLYCSIDYSFYACPDIPVQTSALHQLDRRNRRGSAASSQVFTTATFGQPGYTAATQANFAEEPIGSFGNVHRNPYHGPGLNGTNLILAKNFNLSSDGVRKLQIRMESDNAFNHTQFNNPNTTFDAGRFGEISTAASARVTQLAGKFYF